MEEEVGVKGTVTRLRRRLSVESDDAKSPATQSTPTKKRGGRLAAKPQLELIDENAPETPSKRTRKTAIKDLTEPAEDKPVTPSRRSTRVRSSASTVSEAPAEGSEDKPITPARRNVRARSNTSLISDAITNVDSPRAKRAARRNSQVGSDTDAPITPARQTRRTRKDSASSIDKEITINKVSSQINEVITEELDTNLNETNNNESLKGDSLPVRKSPRIKEKIGLKNSGTEGDLEENQPKSDHETNANVNTEKNESGQLVTSITEHSVDQEPKKPEESTEEHNISESSANLIEKLDTCNKITNSMNKSTSNIDESKSFISKRHRTKSWTTICVPTTVDSSFYSDNEISKRKSITKNNTKDKVKRYSDTFNPESVNKSGSGDNLLHNQFKEKQEKTLTEYSNIENCEFQNRGNPTNNISVSSNKSEKKVLEVDDTSTNDNTGLEYAENKTEKFFEQSSSGIVQSLVYIEDSDSNTSSTRNKKILQPFKGFDDQCVPVIEHHVTDDNSKPDNNYSCEPMDIDETIPNDITQIQPEKMSSMLISNENDIDKSSKRKSSISNKDRSQNLDKTKNEDKSTLVLSQLKDISSQETESINNNVVIYEPLSKSVNLQTENSTDKKNLTQNYSTSTPLQQKAVKCVGMPPVNTSMIKPNNQNKNESKGIKNKAKTILTKKNKSGSIESHDSDDESSREVSNMFDDEAEEASADYESGDSRDEDERQYEEDNAIKEKGETLNSDDEEYSDDSDYEKGSFVVSSDNEDDELLSGSGDDLSLSANELTMSAKSKKKFNERKSKEQKKASKEMFESRHKLNVSDIKMKSKSTKLAISSESEEETNIENKKCRRQRINSSHDDSLGNSEQKPVQKKKKNKLLSESEHENGASEKEITICEEGTINKLKNDDPLLIQDIIKIEPKTPQQSFHISTVNVIESEEMETVNIDKNISVIMKPNESNDPLQNTILLNDSENEDDIGDDSLSENEEIKQNYDSVLKNLNNNETSKIKTIDVSLNLNKKIKQQTKEPLIDELNLTQCKVSKKKKVNESFTLDKLTKNIEDQKIGKGDASSEDSSDSIDMKLLFPEDSNDIEEAFNVKQKSNETSDKKDTEEILEAFIPLKRTDAKTNILEDVDENINFFIDTTGSHSHENQANDSLRSSGKKKKKKPNESMQKNNMSLSNNEELHDDAADIEQSQVNISIKNSSKKKKNNKHTLESNIDVEDTENHSVTKNKNISVTCTENTNSAEETELDISNKSRKKNKKKKSNTEDVVNIETENGNAYTTLNEEDNSNVVIGIKNDVTDVDQSLVNISIKNSAKKNKKTKHTPETYKDVDEASASHSFTENKNSSVTNTENTYIAEETQLNSSKKNKKKNKKNNSITEDTVINMESKNQDDYITLIKEDVVISTKNDVTGIDQSQLINTPNNSLTKKKKRKHTPESNISVDATTSDSITKNKTNSENINSAEEILINISNQSRKKNKKKNSNPEDMETEIVNNTITDSSIEKGTNKFNAEEQNSTKSNKNNKSVEKTGTLNVDEKINNDGLAGKINISTTSADGKNKKKKIKDSQMLEQTEVTLTHEEEKATQKRKRQLSANKSTDEVSLTADKESLKTPNESLSEGSKKKKCKVSNTEENSEANHDSVQEQSDGVKKSKKKNKNRQIQDVQQNDDDDESPMEVPVSRESLDIPGQSNTGITKVKKRKHREDDESSKITKVLKQNSSDKVYIPRLPAEVLKQLDDKPKKDVLVTNTTKVVSTTSFVVEKAAKRKNKPSNYLEQSVYLNDTLEEEKGALSTQTKPKVLPFLPTVATSENGFTTTFKVNIIPRQTQFVGQTTRVRNFKDRYLRTKGKKKIGTIEKYKRQMTAKLHKF